LRNPVYFIFLILLGVGAYVTYNLNLWGPMYQMANAASQQALEEGKKRLREFLEESNAGRQAMGMQSNEGLQMHNVNGHSKPGGPREEEDDDDI
ncbi:MAG: hypothetical protein Q9183_005533, partial [Haloplaca sp. 2 TL-2023]